MRTAKDDPQTITEWVVRTPAIVPTIHIDVADVLAAADTPETAAEYVQRIIGMAADPTSEHLKAEVESLRRWKAEATKVIENWQAVADKLPPEWSGRLGVPWSTIVGEYIDWLKSEVWS